MIDPSFGSVFDFEMIQGDSETSLIDKNSIIIARSIAEKYFGSDDPMGKMLEVDGKFNFRVTGIYQDLPATSHIDPKLLISFENLEEVLPGTSLTGNWGQFNYFAYLLLHPESDPLDVEMKMKFMVQDLGDEREPMKFEQLALQKLSDIHFQDNRGNEKAAYDTKYLYLYSSIAVAILFISFINFVNLSIAGSTKRIKEVGIRKVVGATRRQLLMQFVTEGLIISVCAVIASFILANYALLPLINDLLDSSISLVFNDIQLILGTAFLTLTVAFLSGFYISFFILSFKPVNAIRGTVHLGSKIQLQS